MRRALALTALVFASAVPASAGAQEHTRLSFTDPIEEWHRHRVAMFAALNVDLGFAYLRPTGIVGYGRPFDTWFGLEVLPQLSSNFVAAYTGFRAAVPYLEVRSGVRFVKPLFRTQLPIEREYDLRDLQTEVGPTARYLTYETELLPEVRIGRGHAIGALTAISIRGIDPGYHVYDENLRVIVAGPMYLRARAGYLFHLNRAGTARVGPALEVIDVPGRDLVVVRSGLIGLFRLNADVDVVAQLLPAILSRDLIGLHGADFNQLGIRWRRATD